MTAALLLAGTRRLIALATLALLSAAAPASAEPTATVVARGLANPWGLAFLPGGRMVVTERAGRMRIVEAGGRLGEPLTGLPPVDVGGQCGLLDVVADPRFADNGLLWWTYAEAASGGAVGNSTVLARGRLEGQRLADVKVVFRQSPKVSSSLHCGSRIAFARDGRSLFVGLGDRFSRKDDAQTLDNHHGKVVRIDLDGKPLAENPFIATAGGLPEIFSRGHRNIQGMAVHPSTGDLWASEHGPQGGDEINVVDAGRNYGWPLVTFGRNYGLGTRIGEEGPKPGFEHPLKWWAPTSIAPSGMAFVTSDVYPGWKGALLIGAMRGQALVLLRLDGRKVVDEQRFLTRLNQRIRDVRQGPDGKVWLLTDSADGQLIRLDP